MDIFIPSIAVSISQICIGHPFDTIKVLIQNNKFKNIKFKKFYKGFKYPMLTSLFFNCTVFPVFEKTYEYTNNYFISGLLSGILVSPIVFISDTYKINKQLSQSVVFSKYGIISTCLRESLAMSIYFSSYNILKENNLSYFISGGIAGICNWFFTYPIDVIKSRQIAQQISIKNAINQGKLLKGIHICLIRAFLVNSSNFWVYEYFKKII